MFPLSEISVEGLVFLYLLLQFVDVRGHLETARQRAQLRLEPAEGSGDVLFEIAAVPGRYKVEV